MPLSDVAAQLGLTKRQEARLEVLYGPTVPTEAVRILRSMKDVESRVRFISWAIDRTQGSGMDEVDAMDLLEMDSVELAQPTPNRVAEYFRTTYGFERLFFTVVPFDRNGNGRDSTFGSDNLVEMEPWLLLQTAKLVSGAVATITMIVRVFDREHLVEVVGPKGLISIPEKEMYMFRFDREHSVGFDPGTTWTMHCTDAASGAQIPRESGVRFGSGEAVVALLCG